MITTPLKQKTTYLKTAATALILMVCAICLGSGESYGKGNSTDYRKWDTVGKRAADEAIRLMQKTDKVPQSGNLIVLTNGGYAEVNGASTHGVLDGVASVTRATRGRLVEIHSAPWRPLWFAVYGTKRSLCKESGLTRNPGFAPTCSSILPVWTGIKTRRKYLAEHCFSSVWWKGSMPNTFTSIPLNSRQRVLGRSSAATNSASSPLPTPFRRGRPLMRSGSLNFMITFVPALPRASS